MPSLPLMINLDNKSVIIVGGGPVAERKLETLLETGADLTVVSPEVTPAIEKLCRDQKITWLRKEAAPEDIKNSFLIVAAAGKKANENIRRSAPDYCLFNDASDSEKGNTAFPASFRRGRLTLAVSTNGASPKLARRIKQELEKKYDHPYAAYTNFLYDVRMLLKASTLPKEKKHEWLEEVTSPAYLDPQKQKKLLERLQKKLR